VNGRGGVHTPQDIHSVNDSDDPLQSSAEGDSGPGFDGNVENTLRGAGERVIVTPHGPISEEREFSPLKLLNPFSPGVFSSKNVSKALICFVSVIKKASKFFLIHILTEKSQQFAPSLLEILVPNNQ